MFLRLLFCLLLSIPTFTFAKDLSLECTIGKFTLALSDYGIKKNYAPSDKSLGNHNPALMLNFIKDTLIKEQAYSLEGQIFNSKVFYNYIEVYGQLTSNVNSKLKPLFFNSTNKRCYFESEKFICKSNSINEANADLNIYFENNYAGSLSFYLKGSNSLLTKHNFNCKITSAGN